MWIRLVDVPVSVFWLRQCLITMQDITTGGKMGKG